MAETETSMKRKWLQDNGYVVGSRGKLSAEHEQAYASQTPNPQTSLAADGAPKA